jgi:excisionase family DNA binding protein
VESQRQRANTYATITDTAGHTNGMKTMKKQKLVNVYRSGQARVSDRELLDDDAERKAFDAWWKSSAHKYKDEHPNVYDAFEVFYNNDGAEIKIYDQLDLLPSAEMPQGDEDAPGIVIDTQMIEKIAEGLQEAGYELRKVGESKPEAIDAPKTWDDLPLLLTPEEVQAVLRISRPTFFRLVKAGKIAGATKQGGSWLIDRETLQASVQIST